MTFSRVVDVTVAIIGVVLASPLLVVIASLVRLSSTGPALFRQTRVGRNGRDFVLWKFRSMIVREGTEKGSFDAGSTTRVTPVGRFLRKTKLDELPQLWNVLKGDMSLVGPRPEVRKWVDAYPEKWARVLSVRPGITDPASIEFCDEEEMLASSPDPEQLYCEVILPRKLDLYEEYVKTRNFRGDMRILLQTVGALVGTRAGDRRQETGGRGTF